MFIRSLVGLDREAAAEAFSEFLTDSRFTAAEIRFVQLIVEHLTANGVMGARRLYEAPFTKHPSRTTLPPGRTSSLPKPTSTA